jgi:hypothetical protein
VLQDSATPAAKISQNAELQMNLGLRKAADMAGVDGRRAACAETRACVVLL